MLKHHGAQGGRQWKGTSARQHRQGSRLEIEQPGTWGRVTGEEDEGGVLCQAPLEGEKRETWLGAELTTGKLHGEQHRARERAPAGPSEQRDSELRARRVRRENHRAESKPEHDTHQRVEGDERSREVEWGAPAMASWASYRREQSYDEEDEQSEGVARAAQERKSRGRAGEDAGSWATTTG